MSLRHEGHSRGLPYRPQLRFSGERKAETTTADSLLYRTGQNWRQSAGGWSSRGNNASQAVRLNMVPEPFLNIRPHSVSFLL